MTRDELKELTFKVKFDVGANWWHASCEYKGIRYHEYDDHNPVLALASLCLTLDKMKNES